MLTTHKQIMSHLITKEKKPVLVLNQYRAWKKLSSQIQSYPDIATLLINHVMLYFNIHLFNTLGPSVDYDMQMNRNLYFKIRRDHRENIS